MGLTIAGSANTVNVGGDAAVTLLGNGNVLASGGSGNDLVSGTGNTLTVGTGDTVTVDGASNTLQNVGANEAITIASTNGQADTLSGSGDTAGGTAASGAVAGITLGDNAQANVSGNGNTITLGTGDSLGAEGGGNTVRTGAGNLVYLTGTNGVFDAVVGSDDAAGGQAANGQGTGIVLSDDAQVDVGGSGNTVTLGTGDSLGAEGGGNTVNTRERDLVYLTGTNGVADRVVGSGDGADGVTANGQPTGLRLDNNVEANLVGSNDVVMLATGDALDAEGGGNAIFTGAGNMVTVGNTDGAFDAIAGSGDVLGGTTDQGRQGTGILLDVGAQSNLSGNDDVVAFELPSTGNVINDAVNLAGKIWNLPNTAIGVVVGSLGYIAGLVAGTSPTIQFGNNAIQFLKIPLGNGALTLGNTELFSAGAPPEQFTATYDKQNQVTYGFHEEAHTFQSQALGVFFLPLYFAAGGISAHNPFEQSADLYGRGLGGPFAAFDR